MQDDWLTLSDVASRIGVTTGSVRTYHAKAVRNRREGHPRSVDMPPPDFRVSRSPVWRTETIEQWQQTRAAWKPQGPVRS